MTVWQRWLQHPEKSRVRNASFQIHYWMGMGAALYVLLMSISGSVIVYRDELSKRFSIEWLTRVVEMRYFAGMTEPEIAETLGVTERTVRRDWEKARMLLATALK